MRVVEKVGQKFRQGRVSKYIFDRLEEIGLRITPCYLVQEGMFDDQ